MDLGSLAELGVVGVAMIAVVIALDMARRRYRESEKGDRRQSVQVTGCPNRVEGLGETLEGLRVQSEAQSIQSGAQTKLMTAQTEALQSIRSDTARLVDQHKAGPNGVETWKVQPRMMQLQQESRDLLKELVTETKKNGR